MVESLMEDKRVTFPAGEQKQFLLDVRHATGFSWNKLSIFAGVTIRTLTDWKREKYSLPLTSYRTFLTISGVAAPKNHKIHKAFWWVHNSAVIGGTAMYKKYGTIGDPKKRRRRWLEWWQTKGRFTHKNYFISKNIIRPRKSEKLAEFAGIMMGDGSITKRQVAVTVHYKDDREYSLFVKRLMQQLFDVKPAWTIRVKRSTIFVVISRTQLVKFCQSIGLVIGNKVKQQINIPNWIMKNSLFRIACVRGLMDTDGCIFNECHTIGGKRYCYPRLSFVSMSAPLRKSVFKILTELDFSPKMRNNRSVQLEYKREIIRYFEIIKSSNPKHLKRWKQILGGVG
ncbi:MAG: hypothetical protein AAB481_02245 [Patescibacteria group bacterium]